MSPPSSITVLIISPPSLAQGCWIFLEHINIFALSMQLTTSFCLRVVRETHRTVTRHSRWKDADWSVELLKTDLRGFRCKTSASRLLCESSCMLWLFLDRRGQHIARPLSIHCLLTHNQNRQAATHHHLYRHKVVLHDTTCFSSRITFVTSFTWLFTQVPLVPPRGCSVRDATRPLTYICR